MKRSRSPLLILGVMWAAFAVYVWLTAGQLPERVATHFGAGGQPDFWMTRAGHVRFAILAGSVVPGLVLALFAWFCSGDGRGLNVPNRELWLAPERRQATFDFVRTQAIWFAGMFIAFLAGLHQSTLIANARVPPQLRMLDIAWIGGLFLLAVTIWAVVFIAHFFRKPA